MSAAHVYRIWNAGGVLLYIGSTIDAERRMRHHSSFARWWDVAKTFQFEAFDTEAEARAAEVEAIRTEFPRWNIRHRSSLHPDGYAANYADVLSMYPDDCRWDMGHAPFIELHRERRQKRLARSAA